MPAVLLLMTTCKASSAMAKLWKTTDSVRMAENSPPAMWLKTKYAPSPKKAYAI